MPRRRSTGRTCQRTISPAARRRTGCRCGPTIFTPKPAIDLRLNTDVASIDAKARNVVLAGGETIAYDRLLLATGAEPVRLPIPGADQPHVHVLRSLADCRAIIESANGARRAIVIGASFIGLEAAASLRARDIEVHVVGPGAAADGARARSGDGRLRSRPARGARRHLPSRRYRHRDRRQARDAEERRRAGGRSCGGRRRRAAAPGAGREGRPCDRSRRRGECVSSKPASPGIYAAGDIARWPDPHSGENIRVEHWVVAERQGQTAARNMLGQREAFDAVPFFWSQHYDVPINYVGHAENWDEIAVDGDIAARDCLLQYKSKGRVLAVASIYRDLASLKAELEMEQATL